MIQTDAARKMQKARAALILDQPFFGSLALRLKMQEDPSCKNLWTDGTNAGFNPTHVEKMPMEELKAALCIQLLRLANQHHCRRGERKQANWDRAGEFAVTGILENAGFALPKTALVSKQYDNQEAEAIYTKLVEIEQKDQPQQQPKNKPGQGQGQGQGPQQPGQQPPSPGQGKGQPDPTPGTGEVRDMPGKDGQQATAAEKEQQAQDWKIATQQAAQAAKSCGKLPGDLQRLVNDILEPVIDWKEALRQFVDRISQNDYTFRRPNTRFMSAGIIMPTLYNQELPPIVIAVDTSGSVSQEELKQFAGEIDDILNQYPTTLTVVYCDTRITNVEIFTAENRPIRLDAKGGGGTRFSPVFAAVNDHEEPPACVVYLSDLESNDYGPEPDYPVLWCNTGKRKDPPPPFGEVIRMI